MEQFPKRPFKTHGGAPVPHHKNTWQAQSAVMPPPARVVLPMQQHIGAPCVPTVKKGDHVYVGQVVGDSEAFVSAPIHASVSGTVAEVTQVMLTGDRPVDAVVIDSDGLMEPDPAIQPPAPITDKKSLAAAARASGLVGLGGAGFPAHVKLNVPEGKNIDTLIINVAECEPYVTSDHREALENIPKEIKRLESAYAGIRSATTDGTPISGGGNTREDSMLSNIVHRDELKRRLKEARLWVAQVDKALSVLDDEERLVLDRFYIHRAKGNVGELCERLNLEKTAVYDRRDKALRRFTIALYGVTETE